MKLTLPKVTILLSFFFLLFLGITWASWSWTDTITTNTPIKKIHVEEVRTSTDSVRIDVGLTGYSWTDSTLTTDTTIKATHFSELQTAVDQIFTQVGESAPSWTNAPAVSGLIKVSDMTEARSNLDSITTTADGYACCGKYSGSNTGSAGSCPGSDDTACGTISCDDWHHEVGSDSATGTNYCYDSPDITSSRCEGINDCKDANTSDCGSSNDTLEVSCGTCKYVTGCSGTTDGSCANYGSGTSCGSGYECNGSGSCLLSTSGSGCVSNQALTWDSVSDRGGGVLRFYRPHALGKLVGNCGWQSSCTYWCSDVGGTYGSSSTIEPEFEGGGVIYWGSGGWNQQIAGRGSVWVDCQNANPC